MLYSFIIILTCTMQYNTIQYNTCYSDMVLLNLQKYIGSRWITCAVFSFYSLIMALMCILHASYIPHILNINIFMVVEHRAIGLEGLCQHNKYMTDMNECMQL